MRAPFERLVVGLAAVVCLLAVTVLRDAPTSKGVDEAALRARVFAATLVVSAAGEGALDGATVRVFAADAPQVELVARGELEGNERRLERLPVGAAWVVVEAPGFARASRLVRLLEGEQRVELALERAHPFEVVVVDASGRPVRDASVLVHAADPLPVGASANATGLAAFEALGAPPYALEVFAAGFVRKVVRDVGPNASPFQVKLERQAELVVHVLDAEGSPAAGATVLVAGASIGETRDGQTDASGLATFAGLPRGFFEVRATRESAVSEPMTGTLIEPGDRRELELRLVEGRFVEVFVTDGDGEPATPLGGADVVLAEGGLSPFPLRARSDEGGHARLGPVAPGDASVSAVASGFVARHAVRVGEGDTSVRVALSRGATLLGRVVDERGFPIEGATIEAIGIGLDGMPIADSAQAIGIRDEGLGGAPALVPRGELGVTDRIPDVPQVGPIGVPADAGPLRPEVAPWASRRDGTFEIEPVSPGRVQLLVRHPIFVDALGEPISLAAGERVEDLSIVLRRGGTVEGRVLERSRDPVAAARVELLSPDGAVERISFSAADGTFAFTGVPADVVLAFARAEEPQTIVEKIVLDVPADGRRDVDVVLPDRREAVTFKVVDDRGFRLDGAEIVAQALDPAMALSRTTFSNDAGLAELPGARGLPLRVVARRRGHAPLALELERAPAEFTVTLEPEVSLEGEVRSREGWVEAAAVTLLTASGERHAMTDEAGRFSMGELGPGPARLLVTAAGFAFDERDVLLAPDSRGRVALPTIELARGGGAEGIVVDDRGRPVSGARVAIGRVPTFLPAGPLPPGVAQTDSAGRFVLVDLEAGATSIEAYKSGLGRATLEGVEVRAGESRRNLRIELVASPGAEERSRATATLAVTLGENEGSQGPTVVLDHVPYGGEAQRAGLLAGDELVRIDAVEVRSIDQARPLLDGPLSEDLVLELRRPKQGTFRTRARREKLRP